MHGIISILFTTTIVRTRWNTMHTAKRGRDTARSGAMASAASVRRSRFRAADWSRHRSRRSHATVPLGIKSKL